MIAKITRGNDAPGLVRYLFSDGKANEHTDQRVVAADGALDVPIGRMLSAEERRELGRGLDVPHQLYGTEVAKGYSWHLSLSTKGGVDRSLSDGEWAEIAAEVIARMGFTEAPGRAPCRWVAIRHGISDKGNDHMHLAVNLVREDGTVARLGRDYATVSKLCTDMEVRYGLYVVEGRKTGGMPGVKRVETERAERGGRSEAERTELARRVRTAAVTSSSEAEFVRRLRAQGVAARPRYAKASERGDTRAVVGYAVAIEAPEGQKYLWYSGGKLAKDLSLPALRSGWSEGERGRSEAATEWGSRPHARRGSQGRHRREASWTETAQIWGAGRPPAAGDGRETEPYPSAQWDQAARRVAGVVAELAQVPATDRAGWEAAANQAAGVLGALSARLEPTPGPLTAAADTLARSAQGRHREAPPAATSPVTGALRSVAAVMAQAEITDETAVAWGVVLSELLRLAQAIHQAHLARGEAVAAERLAGEARSKLEEARAFYGSAGRAAEALRDEAEFSAGVVEHDSEGRERRHRKDEATPATRPADYAALVARRAASERAAEVARDRGR